MSPEQTIETDEHGLDRLAHGHSALVKRLAATGLLRRRMLDLGLVPGALVQRKLTSPLGDPRAYLVRGTMIALRNDDAARIIVTPQPGEEL